MHEILIFILVGFFAQVIDGALGMAYGVSATTFMLSFGISPVVASASVHAAEVVTTGLSGLSHWSFGNIRTELFKRLLIPGVLGAISGSFILTTIPGDKIKPYVAAYLLIMGVFILIKSFSKSQSHREVTTHLIPLGLVGGFLDAIGGGGWGPIVVSMLVARGNHPRFTIGSVNMVEFFVAFSASITFILTIGFGYWPSIIGLAIGGAVAAPFAAYLTKKLPTKFLMFAVGVLIIALSVRTIFLAFFG